MSMINKLKLLATSLIVVGLTTLSGCLQTEDIEDPIVQLNIEVNAIDNYIATNAGTITGAVIEDPSGLRFVIDQMGSELPARSIGSAVNVKYKLFYFDATKPSGIGNAVLNGQGNPEQGTWTNSLAGTINAWKIAFTKLPLGTKAKIYTPSYWAYGPEGSGSIPGNTTLVYDVEYVNVTISPTEFETWGKDTTAIETYLKSKNILVYDTITFLSEATVEANKNIGVRYVLTPGPGTGQKPSWFNWVNIKTKYYLLSNDGTIVFQNADMDTRPVDLIPGLNAGLQQMKKGDKATFYIPSGLAFGPLGYTGSTFSFPPDSNLIVEMEFVEFTTAP